MSPLIRDRAAGPGGIAITLVSSALVIDRMFAPTKIKHPNGPLDPAFDMRLRRAVTQFPRLALLVFGTDVVLGGVLLTLLVWTCRS